MKKTIQQRHSHTYSAHHPQARADNEGDSLSLWAKHMGKSLAICVGIGILLLFSASLIAYFSPNPNQLVLPLGLGVVGITYFLGGCVSVKIHGHSALLCGLLFATLFTLLSMPFSLLFRSESMRYSTWISCILHIGVFLFSILGSYLCRAKANQPKRKKRK